MMVIKKYLTFFNNNAIIYKIKNLYEKGKGHV